MMASESPNCARGRVSRSSSCWKASGEANGICGRWHQRCTGALRADIGIAMGAMGSDAAIEAADVVLMDDDPQKIAKAIKMPENACASLERNIIFAIGIGWLSGAGRSRSGK